MLPAALDALFSLCQEFMKTTEMASKVKVDGCTETAKRKLFHTFSGLEATLQLI